MKHWILACLLSAATLTACSSSDNSRTQPDRAARARVLGGPGGASGRAAPGSQEDLVQSAGDRIFFDTDRNSLTPQAIATLDRQFSWLQQYPQVNVWVAGNCDERGTEE